MFGTAVYTLIDNNRFIIIEETIVVERLPDAFEGFKILQISDLHGAYFGEHQADLVETINSLENNMIAFTGDMRNQESRGHSNQDSQAVLDLIDGTEAQSPMYWVDGNWEPFTMNTLCSIFSGTLTPIGERIEKSGVILCNLQPLLGKKIKSGSRQYCQNICLIVIKTAVILTVWGSTI